MAGYNFILSTGAVVPDTSTTLSEVQQEYRDAFDDQELVVDSGPLSVLINAEVQQRDSIANNNALLANQINPNIAGGVFFDAIYKLFDGERDAGERTTVIATLSGVAGTFIGEGAAAESDEGNRFTSTGDATIGGGGAVDIEFQSEDLGPVPLGAGELNKVLDSILGWEGITNSAAGDVGELKESDADAQDSRKLELGLQSNSMPSTTIANVSAVENVKSLTFRENVEDTAEVIDGVNMLANSIFVCVDGGIDSAIGSALLNSKSGGCNWTGDVDVSVVEPDSGQSYLTRLTRPDQIEIEAQVTISPDTSLADPVALTKQAVIAYANGEIDGFKGFVVGADGQPFIISCAINEFDSSLKASRVLLRVKGVGSFTADDLPVQIFEQASILSSDVAVTII